MSVTQSTITVGNHYHIGYTDSKGAVSFRPVEVLKVDDKGFFAHCALRNSARRFLFERVLAVYPAPAPNPAAAALVANLGRNLVTLAHGANLDAPEAALLMDAIADARCVYRSLATA
jgi:predicted DNA-binding transcriptional regulator YafY